MFIELNFHDRKPSTETLYTEVQELLPSLLLPAEYLQAEHDVPEPGSWEDLYHDCIGC